jgi:hypothetical protein
MSKRPESPVRSITGRSRCRERRLAIAGIVKVFAKSRPGGSQECFQQGQCLPGTPSESKTCSPETLARRSKRSDVTHAGPPVTSRSSKKCRWYANLTSSARVTFVACNPPPFGWNLMAPLPVVPDVFRVIEAVSNPGFAAFATVSCSADGRTTPSMTIVSTSSVAPRLPPFTAYHEHLSIREHRRGCGASSRDT